MTQDSKIKALGNKVLVKLIPHDRKIIVDRSVDNTDLAEVISAHPNTGLEIGQTVVFARGRNYQITKELSSVDLEYIYGICTQ